MGEGKLPLLSGNGEWVIIIYASQVMYVEINILHYIRGSGIKHNRSH